MDLSGVGLVDESDSELQSDNFLLGVPLSKTKAEN